MTEFADAFQAEVQRDAAAIERKRAAVKPKRQSEYRRPIARPATLQRAQEAVRLFLGGMSKDAIAERLGVKPWAVYRYIAAAGTPQGKLRQEEAPSSSGDSA